MRRIFFDTNPFVYLVEDPCELGQRVRALVERMSERGDILLTSTMTLGEVLVKPLAAGDRKIVPGIQFISSLDRAFI